MPVRFCHDAPNAAHELIRYPILEKIGHRIYEDLPRHSPAKWDRQGGVVQMHAPGPYRTIAALPRYIGIGRVPHGLEAGRHAHRVTIRAPWRNHGATRNRIPCRVSPFD